MNSVLQCLAYTAPLANYARSQEHVRKCRVMSFCSLCNFCRLVVDMHDGRGRSTEPSKFFQSVKILGPTLRPYRQEDCHEFLRYLVNSMQMVQEREAIGGMNSGGSSGSGGRKLPLGVAETSWMFRIFGGFIVNELRCCVCQFTSRRADPFMDLSLELHGKSLRDCFVHFFKAEKLGGDNCWKCDKCKKKQPALKQMRLLSLPESLTIQLKRFSPTGRKYDRHVQFESELRLRDFMVPDLPEQQRDVRFSLYAAVVHSGPTTNSGHYTSFVRASNNVWYHFDDDHVSQVSAATVLKNSPYLLFYSQTHPSTARNKQQAPLPATSAVPPVVKQAKSPQEQKKQQQQQQQQHQQLQKQVQIGNSSSNQPNGTSGALKPVNGAVVSSIEQSPKKQHTTVQQGKPNGVTKSPLSGASAGDVGFSPQELKKLVDSVTPTASLASKNGSKQQDSGSPAQKPASAPEKRAVVPKDKEEEEEQFDAAADNLYMRELFDGSARQIGALVSQPVFKDVVKKSRKRALAEEEANVAESAVDREPSKKLLPAVSTDQTAVRSALKPLEGSSSGSALLAPVAAAWNEDDSNYQKKYVLIKQVETEMQQEKRGFLDPELDSGRVKKLKRREADDAPSSAARGKKKQSKNAIQVAFDKLLSKKKQRGASTVQEVLSGGKKKRNMKSPSGKGSFMLQRRKFLKKVKQKLNR